MDMRILCAPKWVICTIFNLAFRFPQYLYFLLIFFVTRRWHFQDMRYPVPGGQIDLPLGGSNHGGEHLLALGPSH